MLLIIPMFHVYGMTVGMLLSAIQGGTMILIPKFDINLMLDAISGPDPSIGSLALDVERELHIPVTRREAVRVVIATQERNRADRVGTSLNFDVEMAAIRNFTRGLFDNRSCRRGAARLEEIWRREDLPDGHTLVGIALA